MCSKKINIIINRYKKRYMRYHKTNNNKATILCIALSSNNKPLHIAFNINKTHPIMKSISYKVGRDYYTNYYLHAEIHCLLKCKKQVISKLLVIRWVNDKLALAKPCIVCQTAIENFSNNQNKKIKVFYSTNHGEIHEL